MIERLAAAIAGRGRWILIAGLAIGLASPAAAAAIQPHVGPLVIAVLFLAMLKIGPQAFRIGRRDMTRSLGITLVFQMALPCAAAVLFLMLGILDRPLALGTVLILTAAPITGAAPIAAMAGGDPAPALRQTILGTALLPLTVLPVFALAPAFGDTSAILGTALRLLIIIGLCAAAAFALRKTGAAAKAPSLIDAASAILLALVVIGLMSAAADALRQSPAQLALTLAFVSVLAFGLQAVLLCLWPGTSGAIPLAVAAGNRNVALFLGVLPAPATTDLLLVIGCYQIPMYLTPLILPRLAAWTHPSR
ncbi:hypothetical protein AADZ90_007390 [Aestuariibius sp. 2305UL40-4]|uniref:hypothetical protein n=1 Tax=Aestuariibius violaceus TaxID=3234132 RepID=UPI00345E106B